jgi:predicted ATPase/DNA-binding CsgD family transcriptional regulator
MSTKIPIPPFIAGQILTYHNGKRVQTLILGTFAWYRWLQAATKFSFTSDSGAFIARREQAGNKRGGWYWRAYQQREGKLRRVYLGRSEEITPERLNSAAVQLKEQGEVVVRERIPARHVLADRVSLERSHSSRSLTDTTGRQKIRRGTLETVSQPSSVLPSPLTPLIGRELEVEAICALLTQPAVREVTLTGAGGVGKTRLALAIAAEMRDAFPDGVCFVSLAAIRDPDLVLPTIAQSEGLRVNNTLAPVELLQAVLRDKRHLLVVDNFEQVIESAPTLVDLLTTCPYLNLLVTSREALRVRGEREYVVQPLSLPDQRHSHDHMAITMYGAVALFLERAREVQPEFELTALNAALVTDICCRLDGLPLALELAAARLKVLSPEALLERLGQRLQVLTGGPRDLPARQQTLRQTIAWTYDLLAGDEQRLFRLLSIFVNGCTVEAAEAAHSRMWGTSVRVLDGVTSLLNKHALYQDKQGGHTLRLLLHETIREYGLEALAARQEVEVARRVHAEYYLGLAQSYLESAKLADLLEQLEWENANLRAALHWALERPTSEVASRLETTLFTFLQRRQPPDEGNSVLEPPLPSGEDVPAQAAAGGSFMALERMLERRDREQGAMSGPELVALQRGSADARHFAVTLYLLGLIAWIIGDFAAARRYAEEGSARAKNAAETIILAYLTDLLGQIALDQGEDSKVQTLLEEGFSLHQQADDALGSLNALFFLERALFALGDMTQAQARAEEHLTFSKALGFQSGIVGALTFLGRLALEQGNTATASKYFEESLPLLGGMNENLTLAVATNLQGIGVTLAKQGRLLDAVRLWGAAGALCPILPEERALVARASAAARVALGEEPFAAAWAEGQAMTLEQALAAAGYVARPSHSSTAVTTRNEQAHRYPAASQDLTTREKEVLRLVAQGLTDAQVADALVISRRTVNAHLRSIYTKLNISSRNAATYFALEHNLI